MGEAGHNFRKKVKNNLWKKTKIKLSVVKDFI